METVHFDVKGHIAYITMDRPEKLNAMNDQMIEELLDAFREVKENKTIWVAILTGNGRAFSTGHDLVMSRPGGGPRRDGQPTTDDLYIYVQQVWKPIIAACHGYTLAQGGGMALLSDIRIAAEDTVMGWPQVKRGIASISGPTILAHYIPLGWALKLLFTGEFINAQEGYRLGIFQEVVPNEQLLSRCTEIAEQICANAPLAVQAIKEATVRGLSVTDFERRVRLASSISARLTETYDYKEGLAAFAEKRQPMFRGE